MAEYLSGSINFDGLSGNKFADVIKGLKSIEELPKKRLESWKADWNIRYEAFNKVIDSMREAQTKLTAINDPSKFITKIAKSSKDSILTAKADANALDANHTIDVKQVASNSIWAFNGSYPAKNTSVNTTGTDQTFSYTYDGKTRDLTVPPGTTLESLSNLINKDAKNPGVRMNLIQNGDGYSFQIMGKDTGKDKDLTVHPNKLDGMSSAKNIWASGIGDPAAPIATPGPLEYFVDDGNGLNKKVTVPAGSTMKEVVAAINREVPGAGAKIDTVDGKSVLSLADKYTVTGRGLDGKVTKTERNVYNVKSSQVLDPTSQPPDAKLNYSFVDSKGRGYSVDVEANKTYGDVVNGINDEIEKRAQKVENDPNNPDPTEAASIRAEKIGFEMDQGTPPQERIALKVGQGNITGHGLTPVKETVKSIWSGEVEPDRVLDSVRYTVEDANGTQHIFDVPDGKSMRYLADEINARLGSAVPPVTAAIAGNATDGYKLELTNIRSAKGEGLDGKVDRSDMWSIKHAQNAIFKVDNWPRDVESASNTVKNVIEGVEFTIFSEGKADINISADKSSVEKNIQEYLDAVNKVVKTMQDLSKVEEIKTADKEDPKYDKNSQFAKVKGGALTGNYGTQLLNSRMKSLTSGVPPGFERIVGDDVLSGDMVAALSQMGIKTCTQEGDPNYGLFMIAPPSTNAEMQAMDREQFDKALENNLEDVVNLFAADNVAKTNSADFHYGGHIKGMAKPGSYEVRYDVIPDPANPSGPPIMGDVFINGVKAESNGNGKYTASSDAGGAKSLSIQIDNLSLGQHTGKISIQQGKVSEMEEFLAAELRYNKSEPEKNGSIMILRENYKGIMDNIDKKIEKEEERLMVWERRTRLEYARLDTLLAQYDKQMASMSSQLAGLSSGQ